MNALEARGILSGPPGGDSIRLVTHLDVSRADAREIVKIIGAMRL